jgi:hypothetical protein
MQPMIKIIHVITMQQRSHERLHTMCVVGWKLRSLVPLSIRLGLDFSAHRACHVNFIFPVDKYFGLKPSPNWNRVATKIKSKPEPSRDRKLVENGIGSKSESSLNWQMSKPLRQSHRVKGIWESGTP